MRVLFGVTCFLLVVLFVNSDIQPTIKDLYNMVLLLFGMNFFASYLDDN